MYLDILAEHAPGLPKPLRQQEIVPGRKFTTDFCWPVEKVAVEIEGACHRTEQRFYSDAEKQCLLTVNGWRVLRFTGRMLRGQVMQVVEWTRKALGK
jgi:very-short-patch-repair endonuclease